MDAVRAAEAYESLMVAGLFGEWAPRVADAARIGPRARVLDIACGTGVLAREATLRAGAEGRVAGIDPNRGMLTIAGRLARQIAWHEGQAEALPFVAETFDVVVSQFGLMFFMNRQAALSEGLRVLAPGGRIAFAVWDSLSRNPAYAVEVDLLERVAGRQAADAVRLPFVLGDRADLDNLFRGAGATGVQVSTHTGTGRFPSVRTMVEADLRGWLPVMGIALPEPVIARVLDEADEALGRYVKEDGSILFETSAHVVTGGKG